MFPIGIELFNDSVNGSSDISYPDMDFRMYQMISIDADLSVQTMYPIDYGNNGFIYGLQTSQNVTINGTEVGYDIDLYIFPNPIPMPAVFEIINTTEYYEAELGFVFCYPISQIENEIYSESGNAQLIIATNVSEQQFMFNCVNEITSTMYSDSINTSASVNENIWYNSIPYESSMLYEVPESHLFILGIMFSESTLDMSIQLRQEIETIVPPSEFSNILMIIPIFAILGIVIIFIKNNGGNKA